MAEATTSISRELVGLGHQVDMITTRHPKGLEIEGEGGIYIHYLPETVPGSQRYGWWRESRKEFWRLHRTLPFDIVWSQSIGGSAVARQLRRDRPPYLVPVIEGTSAQMIISLLNALLKSRGGWRTAPWTLKKILRFSYNYLFIDPPVYRNASAVIAVSGAVAASIRRGYRVPSERLHVVHNAVDTDQFIPETARRLVVRKRYGWDDSHKVLLTLGILSRQKGVDLAIEAIARLLPRYPQLRLLVVGSGDYEEGLKSLARQSGVGAAVYFVGPVYHDQTREFYNAADLFLLPTLREEGFANVILEAMASGRPVIASRIGGNPEAVLDGETGFLIPPGDVGALVERIAFCLERQEMMRSLGERARALVKERWDEASHAAKVEEIFKRVAGQR
jgi:glycosyltransferase involved in cell wall biosynthesis